jgi:hypothetical protein
VWRAAQETGACPRGGDCHYAHGGPELLLSLAHAFQERQVAAEGSATPPSPTSTEHSRFDEGPTM